jgi:uncharacterized tellurite resistance protein B-like protein
MGLVFLFFYGLERRALNESHGSSDVRAELPGIAAEVERLLHVYGGSGSFRSYASGFLAAVRLLAHGDPGEMPLDGGRSYELPFFLKFRLGRHAADGTPVPPPLALTWTELHPEIYLRTPAERCREDFRRLFQLRYSECHGEGLRLRRAKKQLLLDYRPASASFSQSIRIDVGDLPDVSVLKQPVDRLREIAAKAEAELDSYSRYLGRRPDEVDSLPALALAPTELLVGHTSPPLMRLCAWIDARLADKSESVVSAAEFLSHWPFESADVPKKRELTAYAQMLAKLGTGFEPDPRFISVKLVPEDKVVLFRSTSQSATPSSRYAAVTTMLQLAAAVTLVDGTVSEEEERQLDQHLASNLELQPSERERLSAYRTWLLANRTRTVSNRKQIESLSPADKANAAALLVALASADGRIDKEEVRLLEKVYRLLGLPSEQLYSDLHSVDVVDQPVVVETARTGKEFALPAARASGGTQLDQSRIDKTLAETNSLNRMLGQIFSDDGIEEDLAIASDDSQVEGLDAAHARLLLRLADRSEWSAPEFHALCEAEGLLPGGASETLNEFSFERFDAALLEGEDPVFVDQASAQEMMR